jgi:hypothetical protein
VCMVSTMWVVKAENRVTTFFQSTKKLKEEENLSTVLAHAFEN